MKFNVNLNRSLCANYTIPYATVVRAGPHNRKTHAKIHTHTFIYIYLYKEEELYNMKDISDSRKMCGMTK